MKYKVVNGDEIFGEFSDWTGAQDCVVIALKNNPILSILQYIDYRGEWGLLQELVLERGVLPNPHFSTWTLAPYYCRLRKITLDRTGKVCYNGI